MHFATDSVDDANNVQLSDAKMTIDSSGDVGIGTTDPQEKLDVVGDINATVDVHVGNCIVFPSGGQICDA